MRSIKKRVNPFALRKWKRSNKASPQNLQYSGIPGDVKDAIKEALLAEQGWLCAYTMQRLDSVGACHIEHVEPQNQKPEKAIDYANMAACFPADGGDVSHGYGAPIKGGSSVVLNEDFVSPHVLGCEKRFCFSASGKVMPATDDAAAENTIRLLELDHPVLQELRKQAIVAWGLTISRRGLRQPVRNMTAKEAERLASSIIKHDPHSNRLEPYCIAISQVAMEYAELERDRAQRIRGKKR